MFNTIQKPFYGDKLQNQFTAYVERALKNNRISYYRKNKERAHTELLFSSEDTLGLHIGPDHDIFRQPLHPDDIQHDGLAKELSNISEKDLSIIRCRIIYAYTYKHIASLLGMKEEAVRVRYFRSIQKIRDNLRGETK